jgi:hypothetical protein
LPTIIRTYPRTSGRAAIAVPTATRPASATCVRVIMSSENRPIVSARAGLTPCSIWRSAVIEG